MSRRLLKAAVGSTNATIEEAGRAAGRRSVLPHPFHKTH